jgi:hypothetical protein
MEAHVASEGNPTTASGSTSAPEPGGMSPRYHTRPSPSEFVHVLSIRARVRGPDIPSFIRGALQEIHAHIETHRIEVQGPPFSISRPVSPGGVDVEVGWPVGPSPGAGRIASGAVPAAMVRRFHDGTGAGSSRLHRSPRIAADEDAQSPTMAA